MEADSVSEIFNQQHEVFTLNTVSERLGRELTNGQTEGPSEPLPIIRLHVHSFEFPPASAQIIELCAVATI